MNTAIPTPAKVAPIKASHRKPEEARHPEPQDPPMTRKDMPVALMVWAVAPMLAAAAGLLIAEIINYVRSQA